MTTKLLEIYSNNDENFSVGTILSENGERILFKLFDEQGKEDGFYLFKKSYISSMEEDTLYLRKMMLYLEYWKKNHTRTENSNPIFLSNPTFSQLIDYAKEQDEIITVISNQEPDELITGYVTKHSDGCVHMECIDMETAETFEEVELSENDIVFLEIESPDNRLLRYANKNQNL